MELPYIYVLGIQRTSSLCRVDLRQDFPDCFSPVGHSRHSKHHFALRSLSPGLYIQKRRPVDSQALPIAREYIDGALVGQFPLKELISDRIYGE